MEEIVLEEGEIHYTMVLDGKTTKVIGRAVDGINNVLVLGESDEMKEISLFVSRVRHMSVSSDIVTKKVRVESENWFRI